MKKNLSLKIEDKILATHVATNEGFTAACFAGDGKKIMAIVETEMEKHKLFTPGSKKLQEDIRTMLQGRDRVSESTGKRVLEFVWNSYAKGIGLGVN
jgi:hypothetical protein